MTWQLSKCQGELGKIRLQYQTQANTDWTSLWVRVPRVAIERVEVQSARHASFFALRRGNDGTWTDAGGFGSGPFTLRITALGGQTVSQQFSNFEPGQLVETTMQFE